MRRRRLLSAVGLALGTAGCVGIDDDASGSTTPGATSADERAGTTSQRTTSDSGGSTAATATVDVTEATLQQALVFLETDYLQTFGGDARYLLVNVAISEGRVDRGAFGLRVDDTAYATDDDRRASRLWRVYQSGSEFEPDVGGLLLFELPASGFDSVGDAAVTWPGGEHRLRDDLRERLRADAPEFSVSVDAPDALVQGESPTFDVVVTNDGTVPGRLVAGLNRYGPRVASIPAKRFSLLVDAGAIARTTYNGEISGYEVPDDDRGDGDPDLRYGWNGADRSVTYPIEYVADETSRTTDASP